MANTNYVDLGRSAVAIVLACFFSLFIFPFALILAIMAVIVLYSGVGLDQGGMTMGWGFFGFVHALLIAIIAGMGFNRMRNYATNIMGIAFILGYLFGVVILSAMYKIGGADAFL